MFRFIQKHVGLKHFIIRRIRGVRRSANYSKRPTGFVAQRVRRTTICGDKGDLSRGRYSGGYNNHNIFNYWRTLARSKVTPVGHCVDFPFSGGRARRPAKTISKSRRRRSRRLVTRWDIRPWKLRSAGRSRAIFVRGSGRKLVRVRREKLETSRIKVVVVPNRVQLAQ